MIGSIAFAVALGQVQPVPSLPASPDQIRAWPVVAEDGAVQRRMGPLALGAGDTIAVWTAAVPQPRHAETLGLIFRRFEFDCPRNRLRPAEALALAPDEVIPVAVDAGESDWVYPGSQPTWVGALFSEVCSGPDGR